MLSITSFLLENVSSIIIGNILFSIADMVIGTSFKINLVLTNDSTSSFKLSSSILKSSIVASISKSAFLLPIPNLKVKKSLSPISRLQILLVTF